MPDIDIKPIRISGEIIVVMIFATWILITVCLIKQAEVNTENRMRVERVEDIVFGLNTPVTQTIKTSLKE